MKRHYSNPTKEQREWTMVNTLLDHLKGWPKDRLIKSESPDFLLPTEYNLLGIEVTTPMNTSRFDSVHPATIRSAQQQSLRQARGLLEAARIDPVEVQVHFRDNGRALNIWRTAQEIADFTLSKTQRIGEEKTYHFQRLNYPAFDWMAIHLGTVNGRRWLSQHRVIRLCANWVNIRSISVVQAAIDKKHPNKIAEYRARCEACWLIVGVQEWTAPEAIDIASNDTTSYYCDFDRLFFVRAIEGSVKELQMKKWISRKKRLDESK